MCHHFQLDLSVTKLKAIQIKKKHPIHSPQRKFDELFQLHHIVRMCNSCHALTRLHVVVAVFFFSMFLNAKCCHYFKITRIASSQLKSWLSQTVNLAIHFCLSVCQCVNCIVCINRWLLPLHECIKKERKKEKSKRNLQNSICHTKPNIHTCVQW